MDSTFLLPSIFGMLVFLVLFVIVVLGGVIAIMLSSIFGQSGGSVIPRRGPATDSPPPPGGPGGPDVSARNTMQAMLNVLDRRNQGFRAEVEQEERDLVNLGRADVGVDLRALVSALSRRQGFEQFAADVEREKVKLRR